MTKDHVSENRNYWNGMAQNWVAGGEAAWAQAEPCWGEWQLPERDLHLLPETMDGMKAIELGCGTGYVSAWMARRGASVIGIDISTEQLQTARRLNDQYKAGISFVEGNAETLPYPDGYFDYAISEYGAAIWCDPDIWIAEAHRVLKPGARLVFLGNHPLTLVGSPLNGADVEAVMHRPYKGLTGADWTTVEIDPGGIEFNRTFADWLALFRETGFEVVNYQELYAPDKSREKPFVVSAEWARNYPSEQVWHLQKT